MKAKGNGNPAVCAANLLRLFQGEVPYERVKGLDPRIIDLPANEARIAAQQSADWLLDTYEPRVDVKSIEIQAADGVNGGYSVTAEVAEREE